MTDKKVVSVTSLQDLADLAGVSRATASRALNNNPIISAKTREKLQKLARKHNYSINRQARDFRLSRTSVVSVVFMLDIESEQHMSDPFFLDMLGGIADCLAEHEYDLLLTRAPIKNILELESSRAVQQSDGVIFVGQAQQHDQLNQLAQNHRPIVVWGHPERDRSYTVVGGDNFSGGQMATRHLIERGRRKIAFFGDTRNPEMAARHQGYLSALGESGISDQDLHFDVPFEIHRAHDAIAEIIRNRQDLDGVFCASDVMALATISSLRELGFRVPEDVAIVGYDDITLAAYSSPALTTIRQNIHWAGRVLVESVMRIIRGESVPDTSIAPELVVRKSSG